MEKIDIILKTFDEMYPDAFCELKHSNALELLIAVMLSAQTTDASVNKLTNSLFEKYKTFNDYYESNISELEKDLRTIGLFKSKAKNLKAMIIRLNDVFNKEVPSSQEDLESLPGVGRKTANVVRSVWFNVPRIAVDTHVDRVSKRLKIAFLKDSVLKVEEKLMRKIPKEKWSKVHHQMIFFGRYHCKSRNPICENCTLKSLCRIGSKKK